MIGKLDDQAMDEVLENNITGRIGYSDGTKIFVVPITYLYTGKYILGHSREGEKIDILRRNPEVCFEVDEIHDLANWRSVILWGRYEELSDPKERYYALDLLIRHIHKLKIKAEAESGASPFQINEQEIMPDKAKSVVYRIRPGERSGRFELNRKDGKGRPSA
jgi:nitroimidazol reductase NimA-like FMN-containing flavoprotein (pyridoxamine 5'-phosphate oxidase superfamily)